MTFDAAPLVPAFRTIGPLGTVMDGIDDPAPDLLIVGRLPGLGRRSMG